MTTSPDTPPPGRALAPDLARGVMLLLIAIANVSAYLWGHDTPLFTLHPTDGSALDRGLSVATILLVDARVYPMFAFLFGYGMVQFARAREARGIPLTSTKRMLWRRHWWMLAFGFVHAALLFSGDVLGAYALTGLVLTAALFWRADRAIRITAWVFAGLILLGTLASVTLALILNTVSPSLMTQTDAGAQFGNAADMMNGIAPYGWAMLARIGLWLVSTPATVFALIVPLAVMLGWLAGRHRWLEVPSSKLRLSTVAIWGIVIGVVGAVPAVLTYLGAAPLFERLDWGIAPIGQVAGAVSGIGYAALFGIIGQHLQHRAGAMTRAFAAVGKRSLSSYLLQSVVFAPLLAAWGFGLGADMNTAAAFAIALGTWLLSVLIAVILERRGRLGPAETLLRRLTYGKLDTTQPPVQPTHAP